MNYKSIYLFSLLLLSLFLIPTNAQYYECSVVCNARFPTCQQSLCDTSQGVCVTTPKFPLPTDCCLISSDCQSSDPCLQGSCSFATNECIYERICGQDNSTVPEPCSTDRDCSDADANPCSRELCIAGFCTLSPIPDTGDPNCCQQASDCPKSPCKFITCPIDTFTCSYRTDYTCTFYDNFTQPIRQVSSPSSPSISYTQYTQEEYGVGEWVFLIVGLVILVSLIFIFCVLVAFTTFQNLTKLMN